MPINVRRTSPSLLVVIAVVCVAGLASADDNAPNTDFTPYGIYEKTAPRPPAAEPVVTSLPLELQPGDRIALIGNTLFDRARHFGYFEAYLQQRFPEHRLVVRNLSWSADAIDLQPRPANFADVEQHLFHEGIDVIFAAFGFNESFAGPEGVEKFRDGLNTYVAGLKSKAFNGENGPRIVLISPIANENVAEIPAADLNNANIRLYADVIREVADEQQVGFVDVFPETLAAMEDPETDRTINGIHLTQEGYDIFSRALFRGTFGETPPEISEQLRQTVIDKDRQFFRRYRPLNTFYYTGNRNKTYGYLDFLPAMRNFDIMVANRDRRIQDIAAGKDVPDKVDDSNLPLLP
jgi:lysophospholipase L1-like esterase